MNLTPISDLAIELGIKLSEIDRNNFKHYKKFPNLDTRLKDLEKSNADLEYIVTQRMGSHHVHGTWTSLLTHYLEFEDSEFQPTDNIVPIHINQFMTISLEVTEMLKEFLNYICNNKDISNFYIAKMESIRELIDKFRIKIVGNDFDETVA